MKIAIGNDHTALEMKEAVKAHLEEKGYEVLDLGTNSTDSCDYPVYGEKVGRRRRGRSWYCHLRNRCRHLSGSE